MSTARVQSPKKYVGFGGVNDNRVLGLLGLGLLISVNYKSFEGVPSMDYPGPYKPQTLNPSQSFLDETNVKSLQNSVALKCSTNC